MRSRPLQPSALLNKLLEIELAAGVQDPVTIRKMAIDAQEILLGIQRDAVRRLHDSGYLTPGDTPVDRTWQMKTASGSEAH